MTGLSAYYKLVFILLMCWMMSAVPVDLNYQKVSAEPIRTIRSPKLLHHLFGGGYGGHGNLGSNHGGGGYGGPHGGGGGSFAGSGAFAGSGDYGGHGGSSQSQSQSASFAFGPFTAAFSQSQAGGGKGDFGFLDY